MVTFLSWWSSSDSDLSLFSPIYGLEGTSDLLALLTVSLLALGHAQIDSIDFSNCKSSDRRFSIIHDTVQYQKQSI